MSAVVAAQVSVAQSPEEPAIDGAAAPGGSEGSIARARLSQYQDERGSECDQQSGNCRDRYRYGRKSQREQESGQQRTQNGADATHRDRGPDTGPPDRLGGQRRG